MTTPKTATTALARAAALLLLLAARPARAQPGLDSLVPPSPAPRGFIADGGPVPDPAARARLDARIADVQRATGGDIGVAILRDLRGRAPVDVGVAIYRAWKIGRVDSIGSARRDLGALLLVVPKELAPTHRGRVLDHDGARRRGELIDARAATICRDSVIPHLRERDYAGAIDAGIGGIAAAFEATVAGAPSPAAPPAAARATGDEAPRRGPSRGPSRAPWWIAGAVGLAGLAGGATAGLRAHRRRRPRPCPRGHGAMVRLSEQEDDAALTPGQRVEERVGSVDYDVWACRVCDERLVIPYRRWSSRAECPSCGYRTVEKAAHTIQAATLVSTGLEEIRLDCANCHWHDVTRRVLPRLPPPPVASRSSSGSSSGGGSGGGSSFGGSGGTAGGGGGSSY